MRFAFGGTPPVAERARSLAGFFEATFDGSESPADVLAYLRGQANGDQHTIPPQRLVDRIAARSPYPLIRHHFGLPTMDDTLSGIEQIAAARVLDVISLGIDQDAQENFFHPERQDARRTGAGGVPVRCADDYRTLYAASRMGNYPLMRTYSGTDDLIELAEMYVETINIAWAAVPLFWFNAMDGRGPHDLERSIGEHQALMAWYARRQIPVELNESHHWGMRDAHDVVFVVSAYLAAHSAGAAGVGDYIAQMMFDSPPGVAARMDLAKMLACLRMSDRAAERYPGMRIWRQTRVGLLSHPLDPEAARGHLAASTYLQMALRPHIVHVVGHTEAHHAATADDVVAACKVAQRAIEDALQGAPDMTADPCVQERVEELVSEASVTLDAIAAACRTWRSRPAGGPCHSGACRANGAARCASPASQTVSRAGRSATRIDATRSVRCRRSGERRAGERAAAHRCAASVSAIYVSQ